MKRNTPNHPDLPHPALALGGRSSTSFTSKEDRLRNALEIMARIIQSEGEEYLPLFLRLEKELKNELLITQALARAAALAQSRSNNHEECDEPYWDWHTAWHTLRPSN